MTTSNYVLVDVLSTELGVPSNRAPGHFL